MKVFVTNYTHRHGNDMAVYATLESALNARRALAVEWWDHELGDYRDLEKPSDQQELADRYWDLMGDRDEWFEIEEHDVLGLEA